MIASALPGDADVLLGRAAIDSGISFASARDDRAALGSLLALDADASARGARVVVGCGLAPGLTDVLARHAAGALDTIDEVHVARWGVAGEGCAAGRGVLAGIPAWNGATARTWRTSTRDRS